MRHKGMLGLLQMLGYSVGTPPTEILPTELLMLGALSVRDAQLAGLQQVAAKVTSYAADVEASNYALSDMLREERARRWEAEQQLADLRIRIQGLSEGARALADEADNAVDSDNSKGYLDS